MGAFQRDAEDGDASTNNDYAFSALSVSYTIAPGLKADITSSSGEAGDTSADSLAMTLKASF